MVAVGCAGILGIDQLIALEQGLQQQLAVAAAGNGIAHRRRQCLEDRRREHELMDLAREPRQDFLQVAFQGMLATRRGAQASFRRHAGAQERTGHAQSRRPAAGIVLQHRHFRLPCHRTAFRHEQAFRFFERKTQRAGIDLEKFAPGAQGAERQGRHFAGRQDDPEMPGRMFQQKADSFANLRRIDQMEVVNQEVNLLATFGEGIDQRRQDGVHRRYHVFLENLQCRTPGTGTALLKRDRHVLEEDGRFAVLLLGAQPCGIQSAGPQLLAPLHCQRRLAETGRPLDQDQPCLARALQQVQQALPADAPLCHGWALGGRGQGYERRRNSGRRGHGHRPAGHEAQAFGHATFPDQANTRHRVSQCSW